ncbi:MAG TPA: hypothetical protein PL009_09430 [Flavipsychrobacter sp.]|nr:hypothetical protein [Flavipsychrobacter sp.]
MTLHDTHIEIISRRLKEGGISDIRLQEDLLDHVCTYIENSTTHDFNVLLEEALALLAPSGLHEIEEERFFLFHFHKQLTMKKLIFFSGFATSFLFATGITFKQMHWPWANILLFGANMALISVILLIARNGFKHARAHSTMSGVRVATGVIAALLIAAGNIFKLFHFPTANIQFVLGMLLLNFVFLPLFFFQLYKQSILKNL